MIPDDCPRACKETPKDTCKWITQLYGKSQGSFCVYIQPMRDGITLQRYLSLAGCIHRMIPESPNITQTKCSTTTHTYPYYMRHTVYIHEVTSLCLVLCNSLWELWLLYRGQNVPFTILQCTGVCISYQPHRNGKVVMPWLSLGTLKLPSKYSVINRAVILTTLPSMCLCLQKVCFAIWKLAME